jgi:hypothetical protein
MDNDKHVYHFKLDFLYQSIAVYAATLVLYLLVRGWFVEKEFSIVWRDPMLYLLCAITLISIIALLYYMMMRRRIEIADDSIRFVSSVKKRVLTREKIVAVRIGREAGSKVLKGARVISIRTRDRRRPIRIRPLYFERGKELTDEIRKWAGPLLQESTAKRLRMRARGI